MTDTTEARAARVAGELTNPLREALMALPLPRHADTLRRIASRPFSSLWRKATKHWRAMIILEHLGLVQRKVSRGETLWRPTRPLGLLVRKHLENER
jgi:hypothetical protein